MFSFHTYLPSLSQYPHIDSNLELGCEIYGNQGLSPLIFKANLALEQENSFEGDKV